MGCCGSGQGGGRKAGASKVPQAEDSGLPIRNTSATSPLLQQGRPQRAQQAPPHAADGAAAVGAGRSPERPRRRRRSNEEAAAELEAQEEASRIAADVRSRHDKYLAKVREGAQNPMTKEEREKFLVLRIQRLWRGYQLKQKFMHLVWRTAWRALEEYDERSPHMDNEHWNPAASMSMSDIDAAEERRRPSMSPRLSKKGLQYPAGGFSELDEVARKAAMEKYLEWLRERKYIPLEYAARTVHEAAVALQRAGTVQYLPIEPVEDAASPPRAHTGEAAPISRTVSRTSTSVLEGLTQTEASARCIVVGDLHGSLPDLLLILKDHGLPKNGRSYCFNGDFVDRGPCGVEVLVTLLVLYIAFPSLVALNRGNHESRNATMSYGFFAEVVAKYKSRRLYDDIVTLFDHLPYCTVVAGDVFVVHGGLPRAASIEALRNVRRGTEIKTVNPDNISRVSRENVILSDVTWSDPVEGAGKAQEFNYKRRNGILFRLAYTKQWCRENQMTHVIRSHECVDAGFLCMHNGMVTTVFSASNYMGLEGNDAAVVVVTRVGAAPRTLSYNTWCSFTDVSAHKSIKTAGKSARRLKKQHHVREVRGTRLFTRAETLRIMREQLYTQRHGLACYFSDIDKTGSGVVSTSEWKDVLCRLFPGVPWLALRRDIAELDSDGALPYAAFLNRLHCRTIDALVRQWKPYLLKWLLERATAMGVGDGDPSRIFKLADQRRVGALSYADWFRLLKQLLSVTLSTEVCYILFSLLDPRGRGSVLKADWAAACADARRYSLILTYVIGHDAEDLDAPKEEIAKFTMPFVWLTQRFRDVFRSMPDPIAAFCLLDDDRDRVIGVDDLWQGIQSLNLAVSQLETFRRQVHVQLGPADTPESIAALFGCGPDVAKQLRAKREATIQTWPLSDAQLRCFLRRADVDGDGEVTYRDFVLACFVRDREEDEQARRLGLAEPSVWFDKLDDMWELWQSKPGDDDSDQSG